MLADFPHPKLQPVYNVFHLNVNVAPDQVEILKMGAAMLALLHSLSSRLQGGYQLCISKKVNNDYCVVWQVLSKPISFLGWVEQYQVFASNTFKTGGLVQASSAPVELPSHGTMQPATGPVTGGSFTVDNEYQPVNFGVSQEVNGKFLPIYVDKTLTVIGTETLTPITAVLAFFSKELTTSSMYTTATSSSIEVTYMGTTTNTISYVDDGSTGNGIWVAGTPSSGFSAVVPRSWTPGKGFTSLHLALDAFAIAKLVNKFTETQKGSAGAAFMISEDKAQPAVNPPWIAQIRITPINGNLLLLVGGSLIAYFIHRPAHGVSVPEAVKKDWAAAV
ncbi:hypothetical protein B0H14DRAFT_3532408 [Mycena olivaceomarginata]|nr:hypothetical protein B0H14DRAFT_3532408 [Mycena olivaceomarginata]